MIEFEFKNHIKNINIDRNMFSGYTRYYISNKNNHYWIFTDFLPKFIENNLNFSNNSIILQYRDDHNPSKYRVYCKFTKHLILSQILENYEQIAKEYDI